MGYEIVHASAKYAAIPSVLILFYLVGFSSFMIYILVFLILGYWLNKRNKKKKG